MQIPGLPGLQWDLYPNHNERGRKAGRRKRKGGTEERVEREEGIKQMIGIEVEGEGKGRDGRRKGRSKEERK